MKKEEICKFFGITMDQLNSQYLANAKGLERMLHNARKTGKKVNGYTLEQLEIEVDRYYKLANS